MSATLPHSAADRTALDAEALPRRPWPRLALNFGDSVVEIRGATVFLRIAGFEAYACTAEVSDWWTFREPGSFEAAAGRLRFSASKASSARID
jgi:hypothetical protein